MVPIAYIIVHVKIESKSTIFSHCCALLFLSALNYNGWLAALVANTKGATWNVKKTQFFYFEFAISHQTG